jgi:parallel beta-helix repeat protein
MIDNSEIEKQQDADKKNWFSEIDSKYQYVKPESYTPLKSDQESNLRKIVTLVIAAIIIVGALSFFIVYMYQEPQKKLEQRTLYVGGTEVERYARIQDAINASNDGDTVYVHIGTYYENLVINQSINLVGENKNKTVIDGDGIGITAKIMADNVNISGFTIRDCGSSWSEFNGSSIFDAGLYVLSDNNVIYKNIIESNSNDGIAIKHSSNNIIFNNQIINNMYDGIICRESCNFNKIYSNSISENGKNGIFLTDGCQN